MIQLLKNIKNKVIQFLKNGLFPIVCFGKKTTLPKHTILASVLYPSTPELYKQGLLHCHKLCLEWQAKIDIERSLLTFRRLYLSKKDLETEMIFLEHMEKLCKDFTELIDKQILFMNDSKLIYTHEMVLNIWDMQMKLYKEINAFPEHFIYENITYMYENITYILFVLLFVAIIILWIWYSKKKDK